MCGIWGLINKEEKPFDYPTFCVLGINNDSRGGDSCGVFIDGLVEYGVNENKLFNSFLYSSELVQSTETCKIALGHCRKASVGVISAKTAQPVCICNEKGDIDFVLMHNGTIWNYQDLAKKYIPDINITGLTDSQVMAQIIYNKGWDVLGDYCGGAVFVVVDYRKGEPRTFFFKGASFKNKYTKEVIEERPFFLSKSKDELVFSSIRKYLEVLRPDNELHTIAPNTLLGYKDGTLYKLKSYNRENNYQDKPVVVYGNYNRNWDDEDTVFSVSSLQYDNNFNAYLLNNEPIQGEIWVGKYGTCWSKKPETCNATQMWFFNGIPIPREESYKLIQKMYKKSGLDDPDMFEDYYENIIRFLSYDQIYRDRISNHMVKATSCTTYEVFNGFHQMLGSYIRRVYQGGILINSTNAYGMYPDPGNYPIVNLAMIKKIWRPLMK